MVLERLEVQVCVSGKVKTSSSKQQLAQFNVLTSLTINIRNNTDGFRESEFVWVRM